jgi:protein arginine kinase activator
MSSGLCDLCGERASDIRFTEIKDDVKTEMNLCEQCARARGLGFGAAPGKIEYGVGELVAGMLDEAAGPDPATNLTCERCGLSYAEFRQVGRLGCAGCYEAFGPVLTSLLARIHGRSRHQGKSPAAVSGLLGRRTVLREKRAALRTAVERENFEEAARLRDECRRLEEELHLESRGRDGR